MSNPTETFLRALQATTDVSIFQPLPEQRRAKSNFWTHFSGGEATTLPPNPSLALALQYGADRRIQQWWPLPGFQDWFLNRDEFRQRMEYLSNLALDELEALLTAKSSMNSDKLSAIKLIMQVGQKIPTGKSEGGDMIDAMISKMSKAQLEEYIQSSLRLLPSARTLDAASNSADE